MTKQQKAVRALYKPEALYTVEDALELVKKTSYTKFDASVDLAVRLGVDPRKADQMVRGTVGLPHGTGKVRRILVLCTPDKEAEAQKAGADHVGLEDYLKKLEEGWSDIDVIITMPAVMVRLGKLGKVLGPKGLMPNPKSGTVTSDVAAAVTAIKKGRIDFRVDKYGIVHAGVGRVSFSVEQLKENVAELLATLMRMKPATAKGIYMQSVSLSSTMGPGIRLDKSSLSL